MTHPRTGNRAAVLALALSSLAVLAACGGGGGGGGGGGSTLTLTLTKAGPGGGSSAVTSDVAGIACGATCSAAFANGSTVTLTAAPDQGSTFTGWSGDCTGTGPCAVTMSADRAVTATFAWKTTGQDLWHAQNAGRQPLDLTPYVSGSAGAGRFALVAGGAAAPLVVSATADGEYEGVVRAVGDLQADIHAVTGLTPGVASVVAAGALPVLVGTVGHSPLIDGLVEAGKLDATGLAGKWETWHTQIVAAPMAGVASALVIAGSDQRGTIYGIYDLSRQLGVSPWTYWDDVAPAHQDALYVLPGVHTLGQPAVKYRGFFINDENPALGTWAQNTFGSSVFKQGLYEKTFELMLRLRANTLWPAVWGRAFDLDDAQNHATAKAYGIVMGTSHEAPMDRGIEEFNRRKTQYGGTGEWSFRTNRDAIVKYWTAGIDRMVQGGFEDVVTVGMRGTGDTGLTDGLALPLMEDIIGTERGIIAAETGKDPTEVPQVWTLYKEVLDYWTRGFRAPADVTIIYPDDNWGNLRALPDLGDAPRSGGYGVYYHFDYVGGGRNYKWVDTNLVPNVWEQMSLAYAYGVDRVWMVNGGDVKGDERPIQFFLDLAWSPETWTVDQLGAWGTRFAAENFGAANAAAVGSLLQRYERLQSRRKPELLNRLISYATPTDLANPIYTDDSPFSLTSYRELEAVVAEWQALRADAEMLGASLGAGQQAAYHQLVLYPIAATENAYRLRLAGFRNKLYAAQGRASTADWAATAQARFADDQAMSDAYNHTLSGGKWNGFQTETKFGYGGNYADSSWQSPAAGTDTIWPALLPLPGLASGASMGVAIDGSTSFWTADGGAAPTLPSLSQFSTAPAPYVEIFSRGTASFNYTITPSVGWLTVSNAGGTIGTAGGTKEMRAEVSVPDWSSVPSGTTAVDLVVAGNGQTVTVKLPVVKPAAPAAGTFVEAGGYVSMRADHYTSAVSQNGVSWTSIPDIGRADPGTSSVGLTPTPSTAARVATPGGATPHLEYDMNLYSTGTVRVWVYLSPRNNVLPTRATKDEGLKYGISIDGETPQVVNVQAVTGASDAAMNRPWERNTSDNVARVHSSHTVAAPGKHTLKLWMVDPTVVVQKLVVDTGGLRDSSLGPPESFRAP